ncbi:MAG: hypothetical protein Q9207_007526 [Kuettlingeria erythrocarpa]
MNKPSESHSQAHVARTASLLSSGKTKCIDTLVKEAHEAKIDLSDDDPETLQRLLSYLYTADYDYQVSAERNEAIDAAEAPITTSPPSDDPRYLPLQGGKGSNTEASRELKNITPRDLLNNALVYALAEKYDVKTLKTLAKARFASRSVGKWDDESVCAVLEVVYATTPTSDRGLRDIISEICARQLDETQMIPLGSSRLMSRWRFQALVHKDPSLAVDLLNLTHRDKRSLKEKTSALESLLGQRDEEVNDFAVQVRSLRDQQRSTTASAETAKKRAEEEQTLLKALISKDTICRSCRHALDVMVERVKPFTGFGLFGSNIERVQVRCRFCETVLEKSRVETCE